MDWGQKSGLHHRRTSDSGSLDSQQIFRNPSSQNGADNEGDLLQRPSPNQRSNSSASSPPPRHVRNRSQQLTIQDVLDHNPTEDACEAYIQHALEQTIGGPETSKGRTGTEEHQSGILARVPDENRSHNFEETVTATATTTSKAFTTTETLTGLVAELQNLHGTVVPDTSAPEQPAAAGGAEALAQAAVDLAQPLENVTSNKEENIPNKTVDGVTTPAIRTALLRQLSRTRSKLGASTTESQEVQLETDGQVALGAPVPNKVEIENDEESSNSSVGMDIENPRAKRKHRKPAFLHLTSLKSTAQRDFNDFRDIFQSSRKTIFLRSRAVVSFMVILTAVAALLYYVFDNPPCQGTRCISPPPTSSPTMEPQSTVQINATSDGSSVNIVLENENDEPVASTSSTLFIASSNVLSRIPNSLRQTAVSWWLLFVVRQTVTFMFAKLTQSILVDLWSLRTKLSLRCFGPFVTLFLIQAKGFPFIIFFWGIYDFALLWGGRPFAKHWLYWQDVKWLEMVRSKFWTGGCISLELIIFAE